jgi:hypothetical protein
VGRWASERHGLERSAEGDDADTLDVIRELLLLEGAVDVRGAGSIMEAEQVLASGFKPSAFLIDLQLDGPRGETFAVRLKGDATYSNIRSSRCRATPWGSGGSEPNLIGVC